MMVNYRDRYNEANAYGRELLIQEMQARIDVLEANALADDNALMQAAKEIVRLERAILETPGYWSTDGTRRTCEYCDQYTIKDGLSLPHGPDCIRAELEAKKGGGK